MVHKSTMCPGCKLVLPAQQDLQYLQASGFGRYGVASSECLALFNIVLAKELEYGNSGNSGIVIHPYAVQHPPHVEHQLSLGIDERLRAASRQSVVIHLLALYAMIEKKVSNDVIDRALSGGTRFEDIQLTPPDNLGAMRVIDVARATNKQEFNQLAQDWIQAAWAAWSKYHERVHEWYKKYS